MILELHTTGAVIRAWNLIFSHENMFVNPGRVFPWLIPLHCLCFPYFGTLALYKRRHIARAMIVELSKTSTALWQTVTPQMTDERRVRPRNQEHQSPEGNGLRVHYS